MHQQNLSRRTFLKACGIGTAVLTLGRKSFAAIEKPNVLFIAIDDLNDWVAVSAGIRK